jgi:hypothetical protein
MEAKRQFIINPHGATSQKAAFFIVTTVRTSNPDYVVSRHRRQWSLTLSCETLFIAAIIMCAVISGHPPSCERLFITAIIMCTVISGHSPSCERLFITAIIMCIVIVIAGLHPGKKYQVRVLAATSKGWPIQADEFEWQDLEMPSYGSHRVPQAPTVHFTVVNSSSIEVLCAQLLWEGTVMPKLQQAVSHPRDV